MPNAVGNSDDEFHSSFIDTLKHISDPVSERRGRVGVIKFYSQSRSKPNCFSPFTVPESVINSFNVAVTSRAHWATLDALGGKVISNGNSFVKNSPYEVSIFGG
jgi:hypothetical protein